MQKLAAITGMGILSPAGLGIEPLWKHCLNQQPLMLNGIAHVEESILQEAAASLSLPSTSGKSLVMSAWAISAAFTEARWKTFSSDDVIILGTTTGQISLWENTFSSFAAGNVLNEEDSQILSKQTLSSLSDDLKKVLKFPGRFIIVTSACSASTQALILGQEMLASGRAKRVIAGGVEELGKLTMSGFGCLKLLNQSSCMPFDQDRSGINLSEGAAFYSLETHPSTSPLGFIAGGDTVLDSYHMTSPNPEGAGLKKAVLSALERSDVKPSDISFVHAHGTGSSHNDLAEAFALRDIFPHLPEVISTKGVHGHALGASGALELGICIQTMKEGFIPPVTGLKTIDPVIKINLPQQGLKKNIQWMLKTTLGFGGVNSALVLKAPHA